MSFSPFDHPILGGLFGDDEIGTHFSTEAELRAALAFEAALAKVCGQVGLIPPPSAARIAQAMQGFVPDLARLRSGTLRDGVYVPELVRQLRNAVGGEAARHVHFGATSQDVIDTALMLRLKPILETLEARLEKYVACLLDLEHGFGTRRLTAYTRMQPALAITVRDRVETWRAPVERHLTRFRAWRAEGLALQFGGAVGTLQEFEDAARDTRTRLAAELGLADVPQWHAQRDRIAELAGMLSSITASLGKVGQDIALMAEIGTEIELTGGGGSSAMAHKHNPIQAETLVALARFSASLVSAAHHAQIHEQERSGSAWMLEWLILPQIVASVGVATRLAIALAGNIRSIGTTPSC